MKKYKVCLVFLVSLIVVAFTSVQAQVPMPPAPAWPTPTAFTPVNPTTIMPTFVGTSWTPSFMPPTFAMPPTISLGTAYPAAFMSSLAFPTFGSSFPTFGSSFPTFGSSFPTFGSSFPTFGTGSSIFGVPSIPFSSLMTFSTPTLPSGIMLNPYGFPAPAWPTYMPSIPSVMPTLPTSTFMSFPSFNPGFVMPDLPSTISFSTVMPLSFLSSPLPTIPPLPTVPVGTAI